MWTLQLNIEDTVYLAATTSATQRATYQYGLQLLGPASSAQVKNGSQVAPRHSNLRVPYPLIQQLLPHAWEG